MAGLYSVDPAQNTSGKLNCCEKKIFKFENSVGHAPVKVSEFFYKSFVLIIDTW